MRAAQRRTGGRRRGVGAISATHTHGGGIADRTAADAGAAAAGSAASPTTSGALAIVLLGWIGAIKTTGATLATVSLVEAAQDMGLSPTMRSAAAAAISLAIAATAVAAGVAADRLGRRRVLMGSYVLAGGANLAIFVFPSGWVYVVGLVVAGLGYGAMLTGSYAYVKAVAPGKSLGMGLGLLGMFTTIVTMVTSLGGGALAYWDWRWLFLIVPAMCLVSFVLTPRLLPPMPRVGSGPVDLVGLALLGGAMVLVISGVSRVTAHPPDRAGWLFIAAGVVLFVIWVIVELRGRAPAFPVRIFRSRAFAAAVVVGLAGPVVTAAMALTVSDAVQYVQQSSAFATTLSLEPFYIAGGVGGLIAGRLLSSGVSERRVMTLSPLVAAAGFLALVPLTPDSSPWLFLPGVVIAGAGIFAGMTAQAQVIIHAVTKDAYGAVTSSKTSIGQLGSALGMVLTMLVIKIFAGLDLYRDLKAAGITEAQVHSALSTIESGSAPGGPPDLADFPHAVGQALHSMSTALHGVMLVSAVVMVGAAALVWVLMRQPRPR